jgi:hypothetical protein
MGLMRAPRWAICGIVVSAVLAGSLPASASVTCMVRHNGRYVCTFFCQDGFVCNNEGLTCMPGSGVLKKAAEAREAARKATLVYNRQRIASQKDANAKSTGYGQSQVYYKWDGDPRTIPTPRYRSSGNTNYSPARFGRAASGTPVRQYKVQPRVRTQLLTLVTAARSFSGNDSNRPGAVSLLRRFVRDNKVPVDVDELLNCGTPAKAEAPDQLKTVQLRWRVPDILPEIEKRGLCAQARGDDEKSACQAYQFGQVVMSVEPELRALCKLQENDPQEKHPDALGECAENKFRNAWAARDGQVRSVAGGAQVAANGGRQCPAITADDFESLRDKLKRLLAEAHADDDDGAPVDPAPAVATQPADAPPAQPEPAAASSDDDPFCAFIARKAVRGELTPGSGDKIPDYCRSALDKAKSCTDQTCSMADVIDRQERGNAHPLPWGSDDYKAIQALQQPPAEEVKRP